MAPLYGYIPWTHDQLFVALYLSEAWSFVDVEAFLRGPNTNTRASVSLLLVLLHQPMPLAPLQAPASTDRRHLPPLEVLELPLDAALLPIRRKRLPMLDRRAQDQQVPVAQAALC